MTCEDERKSERERKIIRTYERKIKIKNLKRAMN